MTSSKSSWSMVAIDERSITLKWNLVTSWLGTINILAESKSSETSSITPRSNHPKTIYCCLPRRVVINLHIL